MRLSRRITGQFAFKLCLVVSLAASIHATKAQGVVVHRTQDQALSIRETVGAELGLRGVGSGLIEGLAINAGEDRTAFVYYLRVGLDIAAVVVGAYLVYLGVSRIASAGDEGGEAVIVTAPLNSFVGVLVAGGGAVIVGFAAYDLYRLLR